MTNNWHFLQSSFITMAGMAVWCLVAILEKAFGWPIWSVFGLLLITGITQINLTKLSLALTGCLILAGLWQLPAVSWLILVMINHWWASRHLGDSQLRTTLLLSWLAAITLNLIHKSVVDGAVVIYLAIGVGLSLWMGLKSIRRGHSQSVV